jgi:GT2 family glycosyltransferase
MKRPLVSIAIGPYNRRSFLNAALESIRANGMDFLYEIIVVDGGSIDGSLDYLMRQNVDLRRTLISRGHDCAQRWTRRDFIRGLFEIVDEFEYTRRNWR